MAATSSTSDGVNITVHTISLGPFTISVSLMAGVNGVDVAVQNSVGQRVQQTIVLPDLSSKAQQVRRFTLQNQFLTYFHTMIAS